jgi:3-mercaptopyruvate sulfurtransferase SseA
MKEIFMRATAALLVLLATQLTGCGSSVSEKTQQSSEITFENSALLVSTAELAASIDDVNQVIIDTRSSSVYSSSGHIRNAVNLPPASFDRGGSGIDSKLLKSPEEIAAILGNAGITADTKVIICGQNVDSNAGRVFWLLEHLGATNVHILDGGYDKWVRDGHPTVTTVPTVTPATFVPAVDRSRLATTADVLANYNNAGYAIVDSRDATDPTGLKTGANLPYDAKHIPNALNILTGDFLNADNTVKSYADLRNLLDSKGITAGKAVITHCYVGYRSGQEYFIFRLMGYDVSNYDGSWTEWNADPALPTASRPNGNLLISGESLAATIDNPDQVIIDVRSAADYALGHIRNAVSLPAGNFDMGGEGIDSKNLKSPEVIAQILGSVGISNGTKIIVYGKNVDSNAGRVFWLLEYMGASNVQMLDGGYDKWLSDGRATVTTAPTVTAAIFSAVPDPARIATKEEVLANYANTAGYAILDSRNAADYTLKHIPNAINVLIGEFLNADATVKSYSDLKTLLDGKGITLSKTIITHCYVGYRSGQEYFILRLMGFNVSNYDGSWTEWSADPTLPTAP